MDAAALLPSHALLHYAARAHRNATPASLLPAFDFLLLRGFTFQPPQCRSCLPHTFLHANSACFLPALRVHPLRFSYTPRHLTRKM